MFAPFILRPEIGCVNVLRGGLAAKSMLRLVLTVAVCLSAGATTSFLKPPILVNIMLIARHHLELIKSLATKWPDIPAEALPILECLRLRSELPLGCPPLCLTLVREAFIQVAPRELQVNSPLRAEAVNLLHTLILLSLLSTVSRKPESIHCEVDILMVIWFTVGG